MTARELLKDLAPPLLMKTYHKWRGQSLRFGGSPRDWAEAARMSTGYSEATILDRVRTATRAVVAGEAVYERDSVLFDKPDYPFALIAALLRAAASSNMRLDVVDFGGSLGSTYRQCRPLLDAIQHLRWHVVEQPHFVETGRQEFGTDELHFWNDISDIPEKTGERVFLLSSTLQYIEKPYVILAMAIETHANHLIIDRTPMAEISGDLLSIQSVPRYIYEASYPCWIFSERNLSEYLRKDWIKLYSFLCPEGFRCTVNGVRFGFKSLVMERKS